jgi:16S rRNA (cytosine1402-N4)-methyltransferase
MMSRIATALRKGKALPSPLLPSTLLPSSTARVVAKHASSRAAAQVDLSVVDFESAITIKATNVHAVPEKAQPSTAAAKVSAPAPASVMKDHVPVMVAEVVSLFQAPEGASGPHVIVDGTCGTAGHSSPLLASSPRTHIVAIDRDAAVLSRASAMIPSDAHGRFQMAAGSFGDLGQVLSSLSPPLSSPLLSGGLLCDLGLGTHQLDDPARGFSFLRDGPLDMRYDASGTGLTAGDILSKWTAAQLEHILQAFGNEKRATEIVKGIVQWRGTGRTARRMTSTLELRFVIETALGRADKALDTSKPFPCKAEVWERSRVRNRDLERMQERRPTYPTELRSVFQALRIAVNSEFEQLQNLLANMHKYMGPGSKAAFISFQPDEDAGVEAAFKTLSSSCPCTSRDAAATAVCSCESGAGFKMQSVVKASAEEVKRNPRARSAHLRVLERTCPQTFAAGWMDDMTAQLTTTLKATFPRIDAPVDTVVPALFEDSMANEGVKALKPSSKAAARHAFNSRHAAIATSAAALAANAGFNVAAAQTIRMFHTSPSSSFAFGPHEFAQAVGTNTARAHAAPPSPASVLPLPPPTGAASRDTKGSVIRPGIAAALVDAIAGMENKVGTLITREQMFIGKASALNAGGGQVKRRRPAAAGTLRHALDVLGMAPSSATVAPGAAGGKRVNFQPETLKQVARTLSNGQTPAARAGIQATVALRLREQAERQRRDTVVKLADSVRASAGRSSESGEPLSRVQSLAIARYMLQQHEVNEGRPAAASTARPSRDAQDRRAARWVTNQFGLASEPFVLTKPAPVPTVSSPAAVQSLKEAFGEAHRSSLVQALRAARLRQRAAASASSSADRAAAEKNAFTAWAAEEAEMDAQLEMELTAEGAAEEDLILLRELHAERAAARKTALASGNYQSLPKDGFPLPADVTSLDHPVLGQEAKATLTRDDARRAFVSWMSSEDRREKGFLSDCVAAAVGVQDLADVKARIEQNRKLRSTALRRGDLYLKWSALLARGYDPLVRRGEEKGSDGALQDLDED